ncbi:hypothetical protein AVEN_118753-1 [Araneus ventricosus]|uniref:Uncharacterized protein n=1 Tax=Araneus ventricosus TaxID=182803 RepID=A0A4Y2BVJ2_ARAVE|nr:hypothetical protein AVEN_118753-1 [Araneus ventricosus]
MERVLPLDQLIFDSEDFRSNSWRESVFILEFERNVFVRGSSMEFGWHPNEEPSFVFSAFRAQKGCLNPFFRRTVRCTRIADRRAVP